MEIDRQTRQHAAVSLSGACGLPLPEDQDAYTRGFVAALQFLTTADAAFSVKPGIVSTASADENNAMSYASSTPSSISDASMSPPPVAALHATHWPLSPPRTFTDLSAATVPVSRQSQVANNCAQTCCVSPQSAYSLATHSDVGSVSGYASPPLVNGAGSEALRPFADGGKNNDVWRYFDNEKCDNTVDGVASSAADECLPFTSKNAEDDVLGFNLQESDLNTESDDCEETLTFSSSASSSFSTSANSSGRPRLRSRNNRQEEKRKKNREAAAKCRAKKLDTISTLSESVQSLKGENSELVSSVTALRDDISRLKEQLIKHAADGCLKLAPGAV